MIEASEYNKCVRCGLCLPTCPTYLETMTETSGPRGRISLIRAVDEGTLDTLSPGFTHQMSECLDCRACAAVCPSGVRYGNLVEPARAAIERARDERGSPLRRLLRWLALKVLFGNLAVMRIAAWLTLIAQRTGLLSLAQRFGVRAAGLAPRISARFFTARGQRFEAPHARSTVLLHAGCIMHVAFAHWHEATVRVLQRNGFTVTVPKGQGCCGAIAMHAGEPEFARELARRNIEAFERSGADYYVVNAAGCGSALKEYGHILREDSAWAQRAAAFSARVRDVLELLDEAGLADGMSAVDASVTYQDACHLAHAQRIVAAPRRLLSRVPGLRLREMEESSVCCGSAGVYNLTQPDMAARLGSRKANHIVASQAEIVATANPGCALQMQAHLRQKDRSVLVKHVIELLDEAYAGAR